MQGRAAAVMMFVLLAGCVEPNVQEPEVSVPVLRIGDVWNFDKSTFSIRDAGEGLDRWGRPSQLALVIPEHHNRTNLTIDRKTMDVAHQGWSPGATCCPVAGNSTQIIHGMIRDHPLILLLSMQTQGDGSEFFGNPSHVSVLQQGQRLEIGLAFSTQSFQIWMTPLEQGNAWHISLPDEKDLGPWTAMRVSTGNVDLQVGGSASKSNLVHPSAQALSSGSCKLGVLPLEFLRALQKDSRAVEWLDAHEQAIVHKFYSSPRSATMRLAEGTDHLDADARVVENDSIPPAFAILHVGTGTAAREVDASLQAMPLGDLACRLSTWTGAPTDEPASIEWNLQHSTPSINERAIHSRIRVLDDSGGYETQYEVLLEGHDGALVWSYAGSPARID